MYLRRNHVIDLYARDALSYVMSNWGSHFAICHGAITFGWYAAWPSPFLHVESSKERRIKANRLFLSLPPPRPLSLSLSREFIFRACVYRGYSPKCARRRCTKESITSVTTTGGTRHCKAHVSPATVWRPVWLTFVSEISWPGWFADCTAHTRTETPAITPSFRFFFPLHRRLTRV